MSRQHRSRHWLCLFFAAAFALQVRPAPADEVVVHENIAYKSGAGLSDYERERCKLDLYLPQGRTVYPAVVWFYGGGLTAGSKSDALHVQIARSLAQRGIAVAVVDYRLSPRAEFPAYIEDAAAGVAWMLDHIADYGGDAGHVFVSGHSAGGYLVAMVGLDDSFLAARSHSTGELAGLIPISGQMVTHETVRRERGLPTTRPIVDAAAPVFHVRADAPPLLAIAGSEDLPARAEENRYLVAAMQAVGHQDSTYHEFEGRTHGSIVGGIPDADDAVGRAIVEFIERVSQLAD